MTESVSITSDGTPRGTRVVTESGIELKGIRSINWNIDVDDRISTCTIELLPTHIQVAKAIPTIRMTEIDMTTMDSPLKQQLKDSIAFADNLRMALDLDQALIESLIDTTAMDSASPTSLPATSQGGVGVSNL